MIARRGLVARLPTAACATLLLAAALLPGPRAHAQSEEGAATPPGGHETPREAVELFQRARAEYQNGQYEAAAHDLENALVLDPGSPTLLYNLGRVYELSGEHERAITIYQRYLRVLPETESAERERTEAAIRRLQGAATYQRADEDVYSQPIYVSQRGVADDAFWGTLIAGGAITLVGASLAIAAWAMNDSATRFTLGWDGDVVDRQAAFDSASSVALAADVVGGIGGATLLAAGLLWVLRERTVELYPGGPQTIAVLAPTRDGAALAVGGTF